VKTRWDTEEAAAGFDDYDDLPERVIGYPSVYRVLGLGDPDVRSIVDYGCGPGKVAVRIARRYRLRVIAAATSPAMIARAIRKRADPLISYHLIDSPRLTFLPDRSVDAAMSCYVFINIGSLDQIRPIAAEVYRVLRPGGRYAILDTNPDTTGVQFSTFRSGDPGRAYSAGERRRVLLTRPGGEPLELVDYHWPREAYQDVLRTAGFRDIVMQDPMLADALGAAEGTSRDERLVNEMRYAPFLVAVGEK
jgi:ubiquinone/menaquinone biosynthesis C-methylase UbiE